MNREALDFLKSRRSIRSFKPEQIRREELEAVLEAGTYAPTGGGRQSPVIVAVQDPATVEQLARMNARVIGNDSNPYYGAPAILLVLVPEGCSTGVEDGTCVLNTMLLAAHAVGLGGVWVHREREMFATDEGKALLKKWGLPETLVGIGSVALGYAGSSLPEAAPRKADYVKYI